MRKKFWLALAAILTVSAMILPAGAAGSPFTDVPQGHWAAESIDYAVNKGYFSGTSSTTFSPDLSMTRGMLWTVLSRMDDESITSAPGQIWYQAGREWAMASGISDGTNPDADITREQLATMLYRYAKYTGAAADMDVSVLNKFVDHDAIASYAVDGMAWAVTHGIVTGTSGNTISPAGLATRSQAAAMLMRFDRMGEDKPTEPENPIEVDYTTSFGVINVPPYSGGETIEVGGTTYLTISSTPYGANMKAGVTYTVTSSDPSVATVSEILLSQDSANFIVSGLKPGAVTVTAIGSDGYKGTITITVKGDEEPPVDTGEYAELKSEIVRLINEERSRCGLHTLEVSEKVMQAAQIRAGECAGGMYSHTRPNGTSYNTVFYDVSLSSGGDEILNAGFSDVRVEVNEWIESAGHHKAMIGSEVNYIGVGIALGSDGYLYYCALLCPAGN